MTTGIEWTDETWNPVTGCTKVSPGCDNCYAERITNRFGGPGAFDKVVLHEDRLDQPFHWRKPRRAFVNSMSDLFHDDIPDEFIARAFAVMAETPWHTYQILTKRPGRMASLLDAKAFWVLVDAAVCDLANDHRLLESNPWPVLGPLPNVWLGVSVEDQKWADVRIPKLLETPAAVRFLSCEPLLGPIDLSQWLGIEWVEAIESYGQEMFDALRKADGIQDPRIDWVIVGGESGPGARPMQPEWAGTLRDQCAASSVPFFFKQWGGVNKKRTGRELDGRAWDEFPAQPVGLHQEEK